MLHLVFTPTHETTKAMYFTFVLCPSDVLLCLSKHIVFDVSMEFIFFFFIMVQLPEVCDEKSEAYKAGYKNICEIGEERIRRAGKQILNNSTLNTPNSTLDVGFRVFRVDSSNMKDVYYTPAKYDQQEIEMFADNIKEDRTPEDLLFQVMLDLGIMLSSDIEETEIAGKHVFSVAGGYLIACFDSDVTEETVTEIAKRQPFYAVFRDSGMKSDSVMTNFEQIFETYSPRTKRKAVT